MTPSQLKAWRKRRGLTQRQAAAEVAVKLETYRKWEQGVNPISNTAEKLIHKLEEK